MKSPCVSASCAKDWQKCEAIFDVETRRQKLQQLEAAAAEPDFWLDQARAKRIIDQTTAERAFVRPFDQLSQIVDDARVMQEMAEQEEDPAQREAPRP